MDMVVFSLFIVISCFFFSFGLLFIFAELKRIKNLIFCFLGK